MNRGKLVAQLARTIAGLELGRPVRVAIDGVGAAGKTVLADELADALDRRGRPVIRAGVDGFHRPREVRYRLGPLSPRGYYQDSFDHAAVVSHLLAPLGPGGSLCYRTAAYDFRTDAPVDAPLRTARADSVLLFDGIFLLRPELRSHWDFRIFVDVGFDTTLGRALSRDVDLFGSPEAVRERYLKRYIPGEKLYLEQARPRERADAIVGNDDPTNPELILRRGLAAAEPRA